MTYNGASDTRDVPTQEGNARLLQCIVAFLRFTKGLVDLVDRCLERRELDHGVWDLSSP